MGPQGPDPSQGQQQPDPSQTPQPDASQAQTQDSPPTSADTSADQAQPQEASSAEDPQSESSTSTLDDGDEGTDEAEVGENGPLGDAPQDPLIGGAAAEQQRDEAEEGATLTRDNVSIFPEDPSRNPPHAQSFWTLQPKGAPTANVSAWLGVTQDEVSSPLYSSTLGRDTSLNAEPLTRQPLGYEQEGLFSSSL